MDSTETKIWEFSPWLPYSLPQGIVGESCFLINGEEVMSAGLSPGQWRDSYPTPIIEVTDPRFDVDCFVLDAVLFVSEKLRQVMALEENSVQYFPVDDSRSVDEFRGKNISAMSIPVVEGVSQVEKRSSGIAGFLYRPGDVLSVATVSQKLFYDDLFVGSLFCTDKLAYDVLAAGCTGIRFLHPEYADFRSPMRFRTLRGLEEEGDWDQDNKVELTTLVERL